MDMLYMYFIIFIILILIALIRNNKKGIKLEFGKILEKCYLSFTTVLSLISSYYLAFFAIFGELPSNANYFELRLSVGLAAIIIVAGGLWYYWNSS